MSTTLLFILSAAQAGTLHIDGAAADRTFRCEDGQDVTVQGASLKITLTGSCGELKVMGSTNEVTIDGVSRIAIEGASNRVTWARNLSGEEKLPVSKVGVRNKVVQGAN